MSPGRGRWIFLALLYSYCAVLVLAFLLLRGISSYSWATVPQLVDGTAHRPFVTRSLVPAVVGVGPGHTLELLANLFRRPPHVPTVAHLLGAGPVRAAARA